MTRISHHTELRRALLAPSLCARHRACPFLRAPHAVTHVGGRCALIAAPRCCWRDGALLIKHDMAARKLLQARFQVERAANPTQSAFLRLDVRSDAEAQAAAWTLLARLVDGVGLVVDDFPGLQYSCKVACCQCLQQGRWEGGPEAPAAWELEDVRAAGGSTQFCDKCNCYVELPVPAARPPLRAELNPDTQLREVVKQINSLDALQAPSNPPSGAAGASSSAATTDADATFPYDLRAWRGPTGESTHLSCCSLQCLLPPAPLFS